MDEKSFSFDSSEELSPEDLAVIRAFDAMDDLVVASSSGEQAVEIQNTSALSSDNSLIGVESPEDMLILFASEADEDIGIMRRALSQVEQDNSTNSPGLVTLGRAAHKLKGTSGAMGCESMSAIAAQIE